MWLADITEHATSEGKLYVCAVKAVFSKRIVGYSIDTRMKSRLAVAALNNAVARREHIGGCILHSDRGSQGADSTGRRNTSYAWRCWTVRRQEAADGVLRPKPRSPMHSTSSRSCSDKPVLQRPVESRQYLETIVHSPALGVQVCGSM